MVLSLTDINHIEGLIPKEFGQDAVEIPGSRATLETLEEQGVPWCIVTSGTRPLVTGWLDVMKLAHPKRLVTAEDVKMGKPDPSCYLEGARLLELRQSNPSIVVFEDAPAGIQSGKAAGFIVVALYTTHTLEQLKEAGADYMYVYMYELHVRHRLTHTCSFGSVRDMRSITLKSWDKTNGVGLLEIVSALV
jgi:glycerol 3-phosphatase-1